MRQPSRFFAIPLVLLLGACDGDDDDPVPVAEPDGEAILEVIHASPDSPDVLLSLDGTAIGDATPFKGAFQGTVTPDTTTVDVDAVLPSGPADAIGPVDVPTGDDQRVTVFAADEFDAIDALVVSAPVAELAADEVRLRVVHAAPNAPMVDVYATAPDADLANEAPLGTAMFEGDFGPVTVAAGDYRIRVTVAGNEQDLVFDSGTLSLDGGSDLVVAAVDNTLTGDAPISLLVSDTLSVVELLDADTPAEVRVVHATPDGPNVDVFVDDATPAAVQNLAFGDFTAYLSLAPDTYTFAVTETGTTTPALIDEDIELVAGFRYSVYAADFLSEIQPLVLTDDDRSVASEAKLRVVHASPSAGEVDVYLTSAGTDLSTVDPAVDGATFLDATTYLSVAPGNYDVTVTPGGGTTPVIGPVSVNLVAGGVYTAAARDADGAGSPFGLILLDDFANPI
mgnify:CR=1 FL=1